MLHKCYVQEFCFLNRDKKHTRIKNGIWSQEESNVRFLFESPKISTPVLERGNLIYIYQEIFVWKRK